MADISSREAAKTQSGQPLRPMETAPKDGTRILIWVRHANWKYAQACAEDSDRWEGFVIASWTDFNSGGWTWHGHCGEHLGWLPLPAADLRVSASSRDEGGFAPDETTSIYRLTQEICDSDAVMGVYAAPEFDCLNDDGKMWLCAIVAEALHRARDLPEFPA